MTKVMKPMSALILSCLPLLERFSLKLSVIFELASDVCEFFDECATNGILIVGVSSRFALRAQWYPLKQASEEWIGWNGLSDEVSVWTLSAPQTVLWRKWTWERSENVRSLRSLEGDCGTEDSRMSLKYQPEH